MSAPIPVPTLPATPRTPTRDRSPRRTPPGAPMKESVRKQIAEKKYRQRMRELLTAFYLSHIPEIIVQEIAQALRDEMELPPIQILPAKDSKVRRVLFQ